MLTPADYVSIGNALLGLLAVFLISLDHVDWAVLAILLALIGDGVDGGLARLGYGGGPFGGKLDSFADFSAFGVAPATLIFHQYYQWEIVTEVSGPNFLTALAVGAAASAFVLAGMLRLIRFEVLAGSKRQDVFVGLAIPAASVLITMAVYLGWSSRSVLLLTVVASLLMVSRFKYPKIRGALVVPSLAALVATILFQHRWHDAAPRLLLSMMGAYVLVGPMFARWKAHRLEEYETVWNA